MSPQFDFFFDTNSPYSYLAATQVPALEQRTGATAKWRPFLLGGVFKATGNAPPASGVASRARYLGKDVLRWAEHYDVTLRFPSSFPGNSLKAQRMLCAVEASGDAGALQKLAMAFFAHHWANDGDLTDADGLVSVANDAGFDGTALLARTGEPEIKAMLIASTEEAVERGAFGAPTFFVGDTMIFGNDRLHFVEEALSAST